jgi:PAS domain-containing protein
LVERDPAHARASIGGGEHMRATPLRSVAPPREDGLSRESDTEPDSHLGVRAVDDEASDARASETRPHDASTFAAAFEALPSAVIAALPGEPCLVLNARARALFGAPPPRTLREHVAAFRPCAPDGAPIADADVPLARALAGEVVEGTRLIVRLPDDGERHLEVDARPIRADETAARVLGAICSYRDVTERALDERMADDLLGTAAHDLRTPLTALKASAQLVARGLERLDEPARERTLSLLLSQVDKLARRVDEVLDAARIRRGRVDVTLDRMDVTETLERVVAELGRTSGAPRIAAEIERDLAAHGDRARVEQVVRRLVFELSGDGQGRVVSVRARRTARGGVEICVRGAASGTKPQTGRRLALVLADRLGAEARERREHDADALVLELPPPRVDEP